MRDTNEMEIQFDSKSCNEGFARVAVAAFLTQMESDGGGSCGCKDGSFGGSDQCHHSRI